MTRKWVNSYKKEGDYDSEWLAGGHLHAEEYNVSVIRADDAVQDTVCSSEC
jgi:hypothetical protein